MKRAIAVVVVLAVVFLGYWYGYKPYHERKILESGDYSCVGCMTPEQKAQFAKGNAGETADGQSEHKDHTAMQDNLTNYSQAAPAPAAENYPAGQPSGDTQFATTQNPSANAPGASQPVQNQNAYPVGGLQPVSMTAPVTHEPAMAAPVMASQDANAPNGLHFGGSGNYQWYRQGSLTWRINTATGSSCIIYATLEEWQKRIVRSHGCGRSA